MRALVGPAVVVAETDRRVEHEPVSMMASQWGVASVAGFEVLVAEIVGVLGRRACAALSLAAADRDQRP